MVGTISNNIPLSLLESLPPWLIFLIFPLNILLFLTARPLLCCVTNSCEGVTGKDL